LKGISTLLKEADEFSICHEIEILFSTITQQKEKIKQLCESIQDSSQINHDLESKLKKIETILFSSFHEIKIEEGNIFLILQDQLLY
jgi:hypothetical protein